MTLYGEFATDAGQRPGALPRVHLRICATSDLHANLLPFDYYIDQRDDRVGLVRVAGLIAAARAEAANSILLDNGDTLQGAPLGDVAVAEMMPNGRPHPMIAAMNALGYDAATLGNHDFDYGLPTLRRALSDAAFPVVLANACTRTGQAPWVARTLLRRDVIDRAGARHGLTIGVTGVAPPQVATWARAALGGGLELADMVDTVEDQCASLRAEGADVVVVLAHSGLGPMTRSAGMENAAAVIAGLDGIDAVIAGHTHDVHPATPGDGGLIDGTPVVQPGYWGSHLGCIDLALAQPDPDTGRGWRVKRARATTLSVGDHYPGEPAALRRVLRGNPSLRRHLAREHRTTRRFTAQPLGETRVPLETYFSRIAPCAATQLVADAQRAAAGRLIADDATLSALPLLSAVAPFRAGGRGDTRNYTDIRPGPLRLRHAADLYIYPNLFALLRVTGADVVDWLERAVSGFRQIDPAAGSMPQPLIDHAFAGYNFDCLDGLRYEIDLSRPPRTNAEGDEVFDTPGRIRNLRHAADDRPVTAGETLLVATNSYRAAGGGHFPACARGEVVRSGPSEAREMVMRHIADAPQPMAPVPSPTWSFTPLGGVPVLFETGPGAAAYSDRAAALGLTLIGPQPSGFLGFTFRL